MLRLLSASNLRQRVIAENIANENTPGFTRSVVRFEELLSKRLDEHDPDLSSIEPRVEQDRSTPAGADGNNVSLETETAALRENRLLYEVYASILEARSSMIRSSIMEGR